MFLCPAQVLLEFKEYATEVDVDFVRKAVRAIGRCAVSIERAAERYVGCCLAQRAGRACNLCAFELLQVHQCPAGAHPDQSELCGPGGDHCHQGHLQVATHACRRTPLLSPVRLTMLCSCLRRYPNRYETIISTLCDNLESLDEPEAKASMIWIIGEYAERIDNAGGS